MESITPGAPGQKDMLLDTYTDIGEINMCKFRFTGRSQIILFRDRSDMVHHTWLVGYLLANDVARIYTTQRQP
jgi:hypothetical protein